MDSIPVVVLEFDKSLFGHYTVAQFSAFTADLLARGLIPPAYSPGRRPDPLAVMIDFTGLRLPRHILDGIDLRMCWLADADLTGSSLRNARMGESRNVSFKSCRLDHADFREVEISGCDFSGATGLETAMFEGAVYCPTNPPKGLPPEIFAVCKPEAEPPPSDPRQPRNPQEPARFRQTTIRCHAIVLTIPEDL